MEKLLMDNLWIVIAVLFVTLPFKAAALWRSARRGHLSWFITFLLLNTLGILELLYIFIFSSWGLAKKNEEKEKEEEEGPRRVRQVNFSSSSKSRTTIV